MLSILRPVSLALLCGLTLTSADFVIENCPTTDHIQVLEGAYNAAQLLETSLPVLERAYTGFNKKYPVSPISPVNGDMLIRRWFGTDVFRNDEYDLGVDRRETNAAFVIGVFDRMHQLVSNWDFKFRCLDKTFEHCGKDVLGWSGPVYDGSQHARLVDSEHRISICPHSLAYPATFANDWMKEYYSLNSQSPNRAEVELVSFASLAHTIIHQLALFPDISLYKIIGNVDLRSSLKEKHAELGRDPLWLAAQSTYVALHNADNYAGFATEVGLLARGMMLPTAENKRLNKKLAKKQIKKIEADLEGQDDYKCVVNRTTLPEPSAILSYTMPTLVPVALPDERKVPMTISGAVTMVKAPPALTRRDEGSTLTTKHIPASTTSA